MKGRTIARRILLVAMLPTVLASLLLCGLFVFERLGEIARQDVTRAERLLDGVALAAEAGVLAGNAELLDKVGRPLLADESVVGVRFTDALGRELSRLGEFVPIDASDTPLDADSLRVLSAPVRLTDLSMFEEAFFDADGSSVERAPTRVGDVWLVLDPAAAWERQIAVIWRGLLLGLCVTLLAAIAAWRLAQRTAALLDRRDAELVAARETAERASAAKSDFLANVSHEVLTPMHSIVATLSMLGISDLDEEQRRSVERAERSAETLLELIRDVLDNSRVEAGGFELDVVDTDVDALLDEVRETLGPRAEERGLSLSVDGVPQGVPVGVRADPLRVKQVLFNLIGNAIKFTHEGGVTLRVSVAPPATRGDQSDARSAPGTRRWCFAVSDTGIGIPAERLESVFEPFTRVDMATTRQHAGAGLGLAICKEIVHRSGGVIRIDSEIGRGTTITVELDLEVALLPAFDARRARADATASPRLSRTDLHLLAVDDQPVNLEILHRFCEHLGATVDLAGSAAEARQHVAQRRYDLVLLDVHMPGEDGFDLVKRLRTGSSSTRDVPVIAITADAFRSTRDRALASGFDDVLLKPVTVRTIARTIERWTGAETAGGSDLSATPGPSVRGLAAALFADEAWARRAIGDYRAELPERVHALNEALASDDRAGLHAIAHALKGVSALLGVARMVEPSEAVCRASEASDRPTVEARVAELLAAMDAAARDCDAALAVGSRAGERIERSS